MAQMASGRCLLRPFGGSFLMISSVFLYVILAFSVSIYRNFYLRPARSSREKIREKIGKRLRKRLGEKGKDWGND